MQSRVKVFKGANPEEVEAAINLWAAATEFRIVHASLATVLKTDHVTHDAQFDGSVIVIVYETEVPDR